MIRMIRAELLKIAVQKKSYILLFGLLVFLALAAGAFAMPEAREEMARASDDLLNQEEASRYFDGILFGRVLLAWSMVILLPIVVCVLTGDCVAGEMQEGSLKLALARSRSRTSLILAKFIAVYLVCLVYLVLFATVPLVVGWWLFGVSPTQFLLLVSEAHSVRWMALPLDDAMIRYGMVTAYFAVGILALEGVAMFLSTLFNRMSAATVTMLSIYFVSYIVAALPFTERIRPWLLSFTFNDAFILWLRPIPWTRLSLNLVTLGWYAGTFLVLALIHFKTKDMN